MSVSEKLDNLKQAEKIFKEKGIEFKSLNDGYHWKIGQINFYPTTHRWNVDHTDISKKGINSLLEFMKPALNNLNKLSVEEMFNVAKKVKPMNLYAVCEALHKEIYK